MARINLNGRERGRTAIIGGMAPSIHTLDPAILKAGFVIGLNGWFQYHPCKYWIWSDSAKTAWALHGDKIRDIKANRFMCRRGRGDTPRDLAHFWFDSHPDLARAERVWDNRLLIKWTGAVSAVHLALILGAKQAVLAGVDICGTQRADGETYPEGFWEERFPDINRYLTVMSHVIPVFKTNPDSPLTLPLWENRRV